MYHKEGIRPKVSGTLFFLRESTATAPWSYNATTHARESKEEKVASCDESEEEEFGEYHAEFEEHDDLKFWVEEEPTK